MAVLDQAQLGGVTYDLQDTKAQAMIAPAFSAAQAYSAGDSVTYNGALYTFTADHAAGAWIGTDAATVPGGVTGEVADLKSALSQVQININLFDPAVVGSTEIKGYILTNVAIGETVPLVADNTNNSYRHIVRHIKKGDIVTITGHGGNNSLLWVFADEDAKLISKSASDAYEASPVTLYAPADGYVVSNFLTSYDYSMTLTTTELTEKVAYLYDGVTTETDCTGLLVKGYIVTNTNPVNPSIIDNSGMRCVVLPVKTGDVITITGNGGNASRLWCFVDGQYSVKDVAGATAVESNIQHVAPCDGYVICNFDNSHTKSISKKEIAVVKQKEFDTLNQKTDSIKDSLNQLQLTVNLFDPAVVGSTEIRGYILTNVAVGETVPLIADNTNNSYRHIVRAVKKGDAITIKGHGGENSLLWVFADNAQKLISKSNSDQDETTPITVYAPSDGYVVSNFLTSYDYSMILTTSDLSENIDYVLDGVTEETDYTDKLVRGYIDTSGITVSTELIDNAGMRCIVVPVKTGDELTITGNGGNASRLWCFTDEQFNVISVAPATAQEANIHHKSPTDGYVICNFNNNKTKKIVIQAIKIKHETLCESWLIGTLGSTNQNVEDLFDGGVVSQNTQYHRQIIRLRTGDIYKITANGGSSGRAYYVLDNDFKITDVAPSLAYVKSYIVKAESNGYLVVNALITRYNAVIKLHSADRNNQIIPLAYPPDYPDVITSVTFNSTVKMSYAEILAGYDALLQAYPNNIVKTSLGLDASGTYTVYRYDFYPTIPYSDRASGGFGVIYDRTNYPVVSLDACIHGNEHPCGRALLNFMTAVCEEKNATLAWLHDNIHFVVIPITNPWGYEHDDRKNSNGVDLNRNFPALWGLGASESTDGYYRGTAPFSEPETGYLASILNEIVDKNSFCLSYHTHGRFEDYRSMTCWAYANYGDPDPLTSAGYEVIRNITRTGHNNHNLPADSGLIGRMQCGSDGGSIMNYGSAIGLPTVTPECMYRYYDGGITADYNTNTNTMNAEYIEICVLAMVKRFLYQ